MKSKHKESIVCLVDATESILNAMEKHGIDADEVASKPEFKILVHLIKTIIDGEIGIPNELSDKIKNLTDNLDLDINTNKTVH
tara:strand:- start:2300 stop:2548 length:249 start_codon:yes stop_codon:yes gene_type:complete